MNRETYDALVVSVEKWRVNATVAPSKAKTHQSDCPLCRLFLNSGKVCKGCPVKKATGASFCTKGPYHAALIAAINNDADGWAMHAQREADFLAALVPAGGPDE